MPQIRPITDLRNAAEISKLCHAKKEPIFITRDGYGDMVIMSMEAYEELTEKASGHAAAAEEKKELPENGMLYNAREQFSTLRRKHLG